MKIQVFRSGRTDTDRVHPWIPQAEEIVEHDRMKRVGQLHQPWSGSVQMPPLVRGADDEHPHVLTASGRDRRRVVLTDEIPVQIHVIKNTRLDGINNQRGVPMGGKPQMTDPSVSLPAADDLKTASGSDGLLEMGVQIDAVNRQQINPINAESREGKLQLRFEGRWIPLRWHLGLQDSGRIGTLRQSPTDLPLGRAVMTRGFHMMKAGRHPPLERRHQ